MKRLQLTMLLCLLIGNSYARATRQLTIEECYKLSEQNYPIAKQRGLIEKTSGYTIENIQKGYLPQLNILGQATYQSAVTEIPVHLPGYNIPALSKDQYKLYGELNQVLYDGGLIQQQKELQRTSASIEQRRLETELYKVRERVNQLFFGILLIDEQLKQNNLLIENIGLGLKRVQAAINNGIAFKSNADVLNADLLKNKQRNIELYSARKAFTAMLSLFIGKTIDEETILVKPAALMVAAEINRPELLMYNAQSKSLDVQDKLLTAKASPRIGFFFQGGIGRPALNMLSNEPDAYYLGGIRLAWSPSSFYTIKRDRALIGLSQKKIDVEKETFLFNTNLIIKQQTEEISKFQQLLASDEAIIALRAKIKNTALAQLENGVINGTDFLREANAEDQARQSKIFHEVQLLMSQYNQQTTAGNQIK